MKEAACEGQVGCGHRAVTRGKGGVPGSGEEGLKKRLNNFTPHWFYQILSLIIRFILGFKKKQ